MSTEFELNQSEDIDISAVLPSYKEACNLDIIIPTIIDKLNSMNVTWEVIIIDTQEPMDDTPEICKKYNIKYVNRRNGNTYGDAIRTAFMETSGLYTIVMDSDGSHKPEYFSDLYSHAKSGNDVIIGSRYIKGGNTCNGFILRTMSKILNAFYRLSLNIKLKDISNSFRMYKTEYLKQIDLECNNFDIVEEILIKLQLLDNNIKMFETPITFEKRNLGKSKRKLLPFIFSYLKTINRLKKIKKKHLKEIKKNKK